jgi:hypothetical protein
VRVQFPKEVVDRVEAGEIELAFRRWRRPEAKAGGRVRTAFGVIEIDTVSRADPAEVSETDARRAGFSSREALFASLRAGDDRELYRVGIHYGGPDPRIALSVNDDLDESALHAVAAKLQRLDARSGHGPWTTEVLALIAAKPGTRAPDLAAEVGRETARFKLDVRKLKELGLTESLDIGYRISPRGRRVLGFLRSAEPPSER